jgi:hypothetical protein
MSLSLGHSDAVLVQMPPLAAVHTWQLPVQSLLQQTLLLPVPTQCPEEQALSLLQLAPLAALAPHVPPTQTVGDTQSPSAAQVVAHAFMLHLV